MSRPPLPSARSALPNRRRRRRSGRTPAVPSRGPGRRRCWRLGFHVRTSASRLRPRSTWRSEPQLQQADLPQRVAAQGGELRWARRSARRVLGRNSPRSRAAWLGRASRTQVDVRALRGGSARDGEGALGPVDHLVGQQPAGDVLQHALAAAGGLERAGSVAASSTSSWSRNGTRASRPHAMVMLSTRLTGSSTSMTSVSMRSARSTARAAPGWREVLLARTPGSDRPRRGSRPARRRRIASWWRSKKTLP